MCTGLEAVLISTAISGAASAATATIQNKALSEAGSAQAKQAALKGVDERTQRVEEFAQLEGLLGVAEGARSGDSTSPNWSQLVTQAAADASIDASIIDHDLKLTLQSIRASIKSSAQVPFLAGLRGAVEGASFGLNLKSGFKLK